MARNKRGPETARRRQFGEMYCKATCEQRLWPDRIELVGGAFRLNGEAFYEPEGRNEEEDWRELMFHLENRYPITGQEIFRTKYPRGC